MAIQGIFDKSFAGLQNKIYPQTSIKPRYGKSCSDKEVRVHDNSTCSTELPLKENLLCLCNNQRTIEPVVN